MSFIPDKAFILAAGLGTRMRPLTDKIPKPMVKVRGKPMLDHALDALHKIGVKHCVINTHYKADIIERHLKNRNQLDIILSHEHNLLDTGGGIKNALHNFDKPFFVLSGDSLWENSGETDTLRYLSSYWDQEKMDILILLQKIDTMELTTAVGDYNIDAEGRAIRSLDKTGTHMFTSIRINAPSIFSNEYEGTFSYLDLLDKAQSQGRLYGVSNPGLWHHISTPDDVERVNNAG